MKIFRTLIQNSAFRIRIVPLIISLTLLFSVLIIATTPPATGYELSIYEAYPAFLWGLLSINIFFSFYSIIRSCDDQSGNLYVGYFSILLIETIILFLPIVRGYYAMNRGSGDVFSHLFDASQILNSGNLLPTDIYPIMHIWLSILHNFFSEFIILTILLIFVFFIFYILSLFILGEAIIGTKKGGVFISIFGIPLIFSYLLYNFVPFFFALISFPLILYAYQKITHNPLRKDSFYICVIILSLFIVFCHPMISVFLIIMFSIFTIFELFKSWATSRQLHNEALNIVIIVSITLSLWWLQFRSVLYSLQTMASALIGQGVFTSILENQMNEVTTSNAPTWLVIDRFVKVYGPPCVYFSISFFFLIYMIYQYFQNKKIYENDFIYSLQFYVAICIGFALMTGYFIIAEPIRAAMYGLVFATILCGLFFYRERKLRGLITSLIVIITIVCVLTIMTLYPSPWIGGTNSAFTYGDKHGIDWILEYRNAEIPIVQEELPNYKYAEYYFETTNANTSQRVLEDTLVIPSHFGYDTNNTIGHSFAYRPDLYFPDRQFYMITTEMMRLTPNAVPEDRRSLVKSFTDTDFIRLKHDPTVSLVYLSNKFEVWNIAIPSSK